DVRPRKVVARGLQVVLGELEGDARGVGAADGAPVDVAILAKEPAPARPHLKKAALRVVRVQRADLLAGSVIDRCARGEVLSLHLTYPPMTREHGGRPLGGP